METIIGFAFYSAIVSVLTYLVKRYIARQDKKYEELFGRFEEMTDRFMEAVDNLKDAIHEVSEGSNTHQALCTERNGNMNRRVTAIEEALQNVRYINSNKN